MQKTKGLSDVYVQSNVFAPGGTSGWHTHPGHSLIIVAAGTVTAYEGDDREWTPHVYTHGMGFVDPGGGHMHNIRNEDTVEARTSWCKSFRQMQSVGRHGSGQLLVLTTE